MKIEGFGPPQQPEPKGKKPGTSGKQEKTAKKQTVDSDSIDLVKSNKLLDKAGYSDKVQKSGLPDQGIKKDLVEVKLKSSFGFYDTDKVKEETSEKIIDSRDLENVVEEYHLSNLSKEILAKASDVRHEKVAEVKQKIAEGFYDDPANYSLFADKLMDHFGM